MARDEMVTIRSDVWDTEVWGAAHQSPSSHPGPKLRFLFSQNDHWVADETMDDLIRVRTIGNDHDGSGGSGIKRTEHWKPRMEVDEEGWPHGFCIVSLSSSNFKTTLVSRMLTLFRAMF